MDYSKKFEHVEKTCCVGINLSKYFGRNKDVLVVVPFCSKKCESEAKISFYASDYEKKKRAFPWEFYLHFNPHLTKKMIDGRRGVTKQELIESGNYEALERLKKKGTKEFYTEKYGEEEGTRKYLEKNKKLSVGESSLRDRGYSEVQIRGIKENHASKSNVGLPSLIEKYGEEEGTRKYEKSCKGKSENSINGPKYWLDRGYTEEEAREIISNNQKRDLVYFIKKYDEIEGTKKWERFKYTRSHSLKRYIERYGEIEGRKRHNIWKENQIGKGSLNFFIDKYGEKKGKKVYKETNKGKSHTLEKCIERHGEKKGKEIWHNIIHGFSRNIQASMSSLKVFIPIYKFLRRECNISRDDILVGMKGSKEFNLFDDDSEKSKYYLYDFTILSRKIIIEYNGIHVHPNKELLTEEQWINWRSAYNKKTADEIHEYDRKKIEFAEKTGFDVLVIWSDVKVEENIKIVKSFLRNHK